MTTPARFLERWSRLKRRGVHTDAAMGDTAVAPAPESLPVEVKTPAVTASGVEALSVPGAELSLPPLELLDLDADFTGFLNKEVSESLRRAALRKLFSDPHFNRMDGLDTYIGDYSAAEPIPPDILKRLRQFETFLGDDPLPAEPAAAADSAEDPAPPGGTPLAGVDQIGAAVTNTGERK